MPVVTSARFLVHHVKRLTGLFLRLGQPRSAISSVASSVRSARAADFACDDREATAMFAGMGGFDGPHPAHSRLVCRLTSSMIVTTSPISFLNHGPVKSIFSAMDEVAAARFSPSWPSQPASRRRRLQHSSRSSAWLVLAAAPSVFRADLARWSRSSRKLAAAHPVRVLFATAPCVMSTRRFGANAEPTGSAA